MRLNKALALCTGMSRRAADAAIKAGRVQVNQGPALVGQRIRDTDTISIDNVMVDMTRLNRTKTTLILHKPAGYVVSRNGQGSRTVYDLLPEQYHHLKPIGRLDKNSSGLLLLTDDGDLAHELTHPSQQKIKIYEAVLDHDLLPLHQQMISEYGIQLADGPSRLSLERMHDADRTSWRITMHEGRNRQIRRTFAALGYTVTRLHRTRFGQYELASLAAGKYIVS